MVKFKEWITWYDWEEVLEADTSDAKAEEYQATLMQAMDRFFPTKTVQRKSTDPPWLDSKTLKLIEERRELFVEEGVGPLLGRRQRRSQGRRSGRGNGIILTSKRITSWRKMPTAIFTGTLRILDGRSGLSTWKYQFSYDH